MHPTQPPSRAVHPTWLDFNSQALRTDSELADLELRVVELEQALVSWRARRRLRRQIRHAVTQFAWAGPSFAARRVEAESNDVLSHGPRWKRLSQSARRAA